MLRSGCHFKSSRSINKRRRILKHGQARLQPGAATHAGRAQPGSGRVCSHGSSCNVLRRNYLTLAAGCIERGKLHPGQALKTVVERHYPRIHITLLETGGTVENLQMLEDGRAQMATAQADILPGPRARAVAVLYDDTFQLLVPKRFAGTDPGGFARPADCSGAERGTISVVSPRGGTFWSPSGGFPVCRQK